MIGVKDSFMSKLTALLRYYHLNYSKLMRCPFDRIQIDSYFVHFL